MRKYLKIAVTAEVKALVEEQWETVLLSEKLNGAELACIAFMKNDAEAMKIAEKIKAKARLEIPIVEVDAGAMNQSTAFIKEKAENYEQKNVPGFLLDLVNFADEKRTTFATPGHHNGKFYAIHPAGAVFKNFFGERMLCADTSDTVPELGDTLTHGTPKDRPRVPSMPTRSTSARTERQAPTQSARVPA